jgi:hypothetical protein
MYTQIDRFIHTYIDIDLDLDIDIDIDRYMDR